MPTHTTGFNITTGAAASTVAISGAGFAPQVAIFWWSGVTAATQTGEQADALAGYGFASDAGQHGVVAVYNDDPITGSNTDRGHRTDACVMQQGDGAMVGWADVQSWDSDGITLEILDAFTVDMRIGCMLIGGLTNYEIGILTGPASGSLPITQNITGIGFQGDAAIFASVGIASDAPATSVDANLSVGFTTGPSNEFVVCGGANDAASTSSARRYQYDGEVIALMDATVANVGTRAEFRNFTSDGLDLDWLELGIPSARVLYLIMDTGGNAEVGVLNNIPKADTSTTFGVTGLSFQPEGILTLQNGDDTLAQDTTINHVQLGMGGASSTTSRQAACMGIRTGSSTARSGRSYTPAGMVINNFTEGAIAGVIDLVSMDSGGFTCVCDVAFPDFGSNQYDIGYLAFAPARLPLPVRRNIDGGMNQILGGMQ